MGQRTKARQIVQVFAQMSDYLRTGRRRRISEYAADPSLELFDKLFAQSRDDRFCELLGFKEVDRKRLLGRYKKLFDQFRATYNYFETAKASCEPEKLPDGINKPALFNMRTFSRELPRLLLEKYVVQENGFLTEIVKAFQSYITVIYQNQNTLIDGYDQEILTFLTQAKNSRVEE
jgi:hypothetical protein